ncbi:MAG: hypothetical protein V4537_14655, partial [Pseudomonadota bacterium]
GSSGAAGAAGDARGGAGGRAGAGGAPGCGSGPACPVGSLCGNNGACYCTSGTRGFCGTPSCIDLLTSPDHCGSCGIKCEAGHACAGGACR